MSDRPPVSDDARAYRAMMRLAALGALLGVIITVQAMRGSIERFMAPIGAADALACVLLAAWLGWRSHRRAVEDREMQSRRSMIIMLVVQLGRLDTPQLEQIATKGGPAAEAAAMILKGRKEKQEAAAAKSER